MTHNNESNPFGPCGEPLWRKEEKTFDEDLRCFDCVEIGVGRGLASVTNADTGEVSTAEEVVITLEFPDTLKPLEIGLTVVAAKELLVNLRQAIRAAITLNNGGDPCDLLPEIEP